MNEPAIREVSIHLASRISTIKIGNSIPIVAGGFWHIFVVQNFAKNKREWHIIGKFEILELCCKSSGIKPWNLSILLVRERLRWRHIAFVKALKYQQVKLERIRFDPKVRCHRVSENPNKIYVQRKCYSYEHRH